MAVKVRCDVHTWMVFQRSLAICRLNFISSCGLGYVENSVRFNGGGLFIINEIIFAWCHLVDIDVTESL